MLEPVINDINTNLAALNIFDKMHEICELKYDEIEDGDETFFPYEYDQSDEGKHVKIDTGKSTSYIRRLDDAVVDIVEDYMPGCTRGYVRTIPLRIVGILFNCTDTNYRNERQVENIIQAVSFEGNETLAGLMGAGIEDVSLIPTNYSTDRKKISDEEYNGSLKVQFKGLLFAIDFNLVIVTDSICWTDFDCS